MVRLLASLLIAESMFGCLRLADLLPRLATYDLIAVILIFARGGLNAAQFAGGWSLAKRQPQGLAIARFALVGGVVLTPLDIGLNLAPNDIYPWLRWHVTAGYCAYAVLAAWYLGSLSRRT